MIARPSIFSPKYRNLDNWEMFRQVDRDKMLYNIMEQTKQPNYTTSYTIPSNESDRDYYDRYITELFELDDLKMNKKSKQYQEILQLKHKFVELQCKKNKLDTKYNDSFGVNFFLFDLCVIILSLLNIPFQVIPNILVLIISIIIIISSVIITNNRKVSIKTELNNIISQTDNIISKLWKITDKIEKDSK